jgi:hypothetical protein
MYNQIRVLPATKALGHCGWQIEDKGHCQLVNLVLTIDSFLDYWSLFLASVI